MPPVPACVVNTTLRALQLQPDEHRALVIIAAGGDANDVAAALACTRNQAGSVVRRLYRRFNLRSVADATRFAVRRRVVVLSGTIHHEIQTYYFPAGR